MSGLPLTSCVFDVGTSAEYGKVVPCSESNGAGGAITVSALLTGLRPGTAYHYRLVATTSTGTVDSPDEVVSTNAQVAVRAPYVGLMLQRLTDHPGYFARLLGLQGISGAAPNELIALRCVQACARSLTFTVKVHHPTEHRDFRISPGLPIGRSTRIEIVVSASGKLSRIAKYSFTSTGAGFAVKLVTSGCANATGSIVKCPRPHGS